MKILALLAVIAGDSFLQWMVAMPPMSESDSPRCPIWLQHAIMVYVRLASAFLLAWGILLALFLLIVLSGGILIAIFGQVVMSDSAAYAEMTTDEVREANATAWSEALLSDVSDEMC